MTAEQSSERRALAELLARHSYKRGTFRLASGKQSDFYVDVKQTVFRSDGAALLGRILHGHLLGHGIAQVGGMAVGAVPLVAAALVEAGRSDTRLEGFFVRRDVKDHGTARKLDGCFRADARIALLEDVVTTGESTLQAVDAVERAGGNVSMIVTVVDRQEDDGMARLRARVATVEALATRAEIVSAADRQSG